MNDSFLADLELVNVEPRRETNDKPRDAQRHITRRRSQTASPLLAVPASPVAEDDENLAIIIQSSALPVKVARERVHNDGKNLPARRSKSGSRETRTFGEGESRALATRDSNVARARTAAGRSKPESEERPRRSTGSGGETSRSSEASAKENSRPSAESSRDSAARSDPKDRARDRGSGDASRRKHDEKFEVAVLNSVKEIVGTYTRNESTKILRAIQESYINTQANLIKLMLLRDENSPVEAAYREDSGASRSELIEENAGLRSELRRALEESRAIRREYNLLQSRYKELVECGGSGSNGRSTSVAASRANSSAIRARQGKLAELYRNSE